MIKKRCFWEGLQYFASPDLWKRYFWKVQNTRIPIGSYLSQNNSQLERMSSWFLRGGREILVTFNPCDPWNSLRKASGNFGTMTNFAPLIEIYLPWNFHKFSLSRCWETPEREESPWWQSSFIQYFPLQADRFKWFLFLEISIISSPSSVRFSIVAVVNYTKPLEGQKHSFYRNVPHFPNLLQTESETDTCTQLQT